MTAASYELRFARSLYQPAAVRQAVDTYADFANITTEEGDAYTVVTLQPADDVDGLELRGEFQNFVLARSVGPRT
jgi:hypothetical protein